MELFGEEISTEHVQSSELFGKTLGLDETLRHEHVFADEFEIGHDDGDGSEKGLETFGEFGSTQVTWVHCDKDTTCDIE
jgi:hypothetical protein